MGRHAKASTAGSITCKAIGLRPLGIAFASLLALLGVCLWSASPALAAESRLPASFSPLLEPESATDPITDPNAVAVDETSGNVFVNDAGSHTQILNGQGTSPTGAPTGLVAPYLLTSGCSFGVAANGNVLAVDNSITSPAKGTVYVACVNNKIQRFTRNPGTEKYEAGAEISYAGAAANAGGAVDADGNLFVASFNPSAVYKFSPAGALLETIAIPTTRRPSSIAIDSAGNLFYRQAATSKVFRCPKEVTGAINPAACVQVINEAEITGLTGIVIDRTRGKLYLALGNRAAQYDVATLTRDFEFGAGVLEATRGIAVNAATDRVYVSDTGEAKGDVVAVFAPPVTLPSATTKAASGVTGTKATLNGVVSPRSLTITQCKFEYGTTTSYGSSVPCKESVPTDSSDHAVSADISGLQPNGATYHFRLVVQSVAGPAAPQGSDRTLVTASTVITGAASGIQAATATLNGTVRPEGSQLTACKFEYGETTLYGQSVSCSPSAGSIPDDFDPHVVTGALSGLKANTTYHFRLSATNNASGTALGQDLSFTTLGPPQILQQVPVDVEKDNATLQAQINPSGAATTYYFEWGPAGSYSNRIPVDHELFVGSGTEPVTVAAKVAGLQAATEYQFRVIAKNFRGTALGEDQPFETLSENNLPNVRAAELVSIPDKRPVGNIEQLAHSQVYYQPTENGDQMGYLVLNGVGDTPAGGEVIYGASRSAKEWSSTAISSPSSIPAPSVPGGPFFATPSRVKYLDSENLKCGILQTHNPLTADTPQASIEQGVVNLYRWNAADSTYTLLTNRIPLNPGAVTSAEYLISGASRDCSRIFFYSPNYSFFDDASGLYEWHDGVLRDAGLWPDSGGGEPDVLVPAFGEQILRAKNTVAENGHFFFGATSVEGADSGKRAVFVRKGPDEVVDASQPTHGPTLGARYEGASPDGRRVFFLANYGIAATSSTGSSENCASESVVISDTACDLYSYDVETEELTDISASTNPADTKGAVAQGVMAISEDGSVVYFAARGQLVPGKGRTYAQNLLGGLSGGFANVYRYDFDAAPAESLTYVGSLTAGDVRNQGLMHNGNGWTSQTNDAGSYFLYASQDNMTGSNPAGTELAYVYSDDNGVNECVSCPRDGSQPHARYVSAPGAPHAIGAGPSFESKGFATTTGTSLSDDGRVIFNSEDVLAPGGIEGEGKLVGTLISQFPTQTNVYEWHRGQVSLLATGAVLELGMGGPDGRDIFIRSYEQLDGHDFDFNADVYDLRAGGGFAPPPDPLVPCDPAADQCQGPPGSAPAAPNPASSSFTGPGNPAAKKSKSCSKGKVRKGGKCVAKGKTKKKSHKRAAKANRGGVK